MKLVDKTQEQIKQMILDKAYDENGFLPSEGELCEQLEVSRSTVREAVRSLEIRGFVRRMHGKGVQVNNAGFKVFTQSMIDMLDQDNVDLDDMLQVRRIVEVEVAGIAAGHATPQMLEELLTQIEIMENEHSNTQPYINADLKFHRTLVKAAGNSMLTAIMDAYSFFLRDLIEASCQQEESIEKRFGYHRNVYAAVVDGDCERARDTMRIHLQATEENKKNFS